MLSIQCLWYQKPHPYLGASLDAIVIDIDSGEKWGIEIKCPSSKYNQHIDDVLKDKKLKITHCYYYQIQSQIFCTWLTRVDFVVWFGYHLPLYTETVRFDEKLAKSITSYRSLLL